MTVSARRRRSSSFSERAAEALRNVELRVENALTILWDDLQHWQQDNQYIISGYRPASASFRKCFHSLFYMHNESVNIYTHLVGSVLFLIFLYDLHSLAAPRYPVSTPADVVSFSTFFLSAALCMGMSATFHTISNHSLPVCSFGNKLDYLGIVILIVGSFLPSLHYGFHCAPHLTTSYSLLLSGLGLVCAAVTLIERFRSPAYRPFRAGMFVALGLSGAIPVVHGLVGYGVYERIGMPWVLLEAVLYIAGAGIYAARVPEKWAPGRFDIVGASHQVFHVAVVLAALSHFKGMVQMFDYLHSPMGNVC